MSNDVIKEIFELKQENIMLKQANTDLNLKSYRSLQLTSPCFVVQIPSRNILYI